ncbi:hypothetical protein NQ317_019224 [Molorchus minor]|uniref:Post-SET domain-containing protein n=1 Tax=Molorchus minor TaxID=1323400 RepID=A0ABQ9JS75_9CUCU|nr:hypothetical protein NQ317_019224 [Molorchus minor]
MLSSSSHNMPNNNSYSNDRGASFDAEYAVDPASGGFFHADFKKHDDLKEMLDSNKDSLKLEAMKLIIGMVAKGRDASMLFPAVVKNVVSKNIEVKKLVYVYLERYAEEQQDLALLSISTFQRALKEPNQLIRAGALRVLSSVRVKMISPIVMLAIRDASSDMSPYVRKTAAHAIPKLYSLDPELKSELVTEVCPERVDLIHKVYRKLCALLVDVDEWGQVTIVDMLTRYARSQFRNPNLQREESEKEFYDSSSDTSEKPSATLDPDHRLLLRSSRPLLQSRNAAVVMSVAQLYHHAAPKPESLLAAKSLVRLLRSHLEVLTNLTTDGNVSTILRELQTYISSSDKYFVAATIQAIGRCACSISEVTDSCLNGLVSLLSNRDEAVVAESVVVIKKLLQTQAADPKEIIAHMARLLDSITVAQARAAILWLLGEHNKKVPHIAPDVLRKMAKTFAEESDLVKLQIMNLAIKLYITNPEQTSLLCQYIFNLARYDQNYDIRDKARLLKQFVPNQDGKIKSKAAKIFLASKPAPLLQSQLRDQEDFQLGSLSHYIKQRATGYEPLPPFPDIPPPSDVRNVEPIMGDDAKQLKNSDKGSKRNSEFMWETEPSSPDNSSSGSSSNQSSSSGSGSSSGSDEESSEEQSESEEEESEKKKDSLSEESESAFEESSSEEETPVKKVKSKNQKPIAQDTKKNQTWISCFFTPVISIDAPLTMQVVQPIFVNTRSIELLNKMNGRGLSATYRFTRSPHLYSPSMTNINITFFNNTSQDIVDIRLGKKNLAVGMTIHDFACISKLPPNCSLPATLGVDFNDTTQPANFEIVSSLGNFNVCIKPKVGELLRPMKMPKNLFIEKQSALRGMNEHSTTLSQCIPNVIERIQEITNLGPCDNSESDYFRLLQMEDLRISPIFKTENNMRRMPSLTMKLELTEENLDYFLQQEYSLSQMCYEADRLSLDGLDDLWTPQVLPKPEKSYSDKKTVMLDIINSESITSECLTDKETLNEDEKMEIDQENQLLEQEELDKVPFKVGINEHELFPLYKFCENYKFNFEINFKGYIHKVILDQAYQSIPLLFVVPKKNNLMSKNTFIKNEIVFQTLNLIHISKAFHNERTLFLKCNKSIKNPFQFNYLKQVLTEIYPKQFKKFNTQYDISTEIYQTSIAAFIDSQEKVEHNYEKEPIDTIKNNEYYKEILAVSPILHQSVGALETCSLQIKTANKVLNKSSLNGPHYENPINAIPAKSNLKKQISPFETKKNKEQKSSLTFTTVTTFYFERSQGFSSVPSKDLYENKKHENDLPKRRTNSIYQKKTDSQEKLQIVQALNINQRVQLLQSAEVQIQLNEEEDCDYLRFSRALVGCDCKEYCYPDICSCSLDGIECQVDRPNFPCGCSKENCRNVMGRNEYSPNRVKTHCSKTIRRMKMEHKGRISKRKQMLPSKLLLSI